LFGREKEKEKNWGLASVSGELRFVSTARKEKACALSYQSAAQKRKENARANSTQARRSIPCKM
jgi:hypothetical protein